MGLRARYRRLAVLFALAALGAACATTRAEADATRDRTISFYGVNTKETLTIQYMKDGKRIPEAMQKINWALRDWRRDEPTQMDPDLIDLVWEIHNELGSKEPIHVISAYRSRASNDMLRRTVGGQASESRHIYGKAMDVQFPDVPVKKLRYSALLRERGGVGYYPTSATPFVHIDTDRVRAWPRVTRAELALLFPSGRTQHLPSDGGPITPDDVRRARASNSELVTQIAEFHQERSRPRPPVQVASLAPSLPQLLAMPRIAQRQPGAGTQPTAAERARLAALADAPLPQLVAGPLPVMRPRPSVEVPAWGQPHVAAEPQSWGDMRVAAAAAAAADRPDARAELRAPLSRETAFVPAPAYDEEHPEELSYRPFPIAPFLTATASVDDPALARVVHPDLAKSLEMLDQAAFAPRLRLRPGLQAAQRLWAHEFRGEAIDLSDLIAGGAPGAGPSLPPPGSPLLGRRVATQAP